MAKGVTGTRLITKITPGNLNNVGMRTPSCACTLVFEIMAGLTVILFVACGGITAATNELGGVEAVVTVGAPNFPIDFYQGQDQLTGTIATLADFRGQPVALNFWAGLCPPCRAEMPDLQNFANDFEGKAVMLGIDVGEFTGLGNKEDAKQLLIDLGVTYPAGSTDDPTVIPKFQVLSMPTTVFIDTEGKIFRKWNGALNQEILADITNEMLTQ